MNNKKNKKQSRSNSAAPAAPQSPVPAAPTFAPDYSMVVKDLRRIGVLAGAFVTLLIIASFFLQ